MTLCGQIVNLVGLNALNDPNQTGAVGQVAVVQDKVSVSDMRAWYR